MFESEVQSWKYQDERVAKLRYPRRARSTDNRQLRSKGFVLFLCLMFSMLPAKAGGSWERVLIEEISINGVDYTLVVIPSDSANADPYLGRCRRFEIRGTYRWLRGTLFQQEPGLSRAEHLRALEFLRHAHETKRQVDLGWIGVGFVPLNRRTHVLFAAARSNCSGTGKEPTSSLTTRQRQLAANGCCELRSKAGAPRKIENVGGRLWRLGSESNRRRRLCRPLHDHSAT